VFSSETSFPAAQTTRAEETSIISFRAFEYVDPPHEQFIMKAPILVA